MSEHTAFSGLHAVIAEDSQHMRTLLRSMLRALGFGQVAAESNGEDALRLISSGWADVVLLDWNMPGLSGIDVFRAIRAFPDPICRVPVMMVTAHASPQRLQLSKSLGVNSFLCKPVSLKALESRLLKIIQEPYAARIDDLGPSSRRTKKPVPEPSVEDEPLKTRSTDERDDELENFYV